MKRFSAFAFLLCLAVPVSVAWAGDYQLPPNLIPLVSPEGRALLLEAEGQRAFLPLVSQFTTQQTQEFCGVASSVMVLNALGVPAPVDPPYEPYRYFTQEDFFSPETEAILPRSSTTCTGMTLDQLAAQLRVHGATTRVVHAEDGSVSQFRDDIRTAFSEDDTYVIMNYLGTAIGQTENFGHFSPIAALAPEGDRVLVLDVARFVYAPFWADTAELFAAMSAPDSGNGNRSRGYVIVSRP